MSSTYDQIEDNGSFMINSRTVLRMQCCDCCLVHDYTFINKKDGTLKVKVAADRRATAQLRRNGGGDLQQKKGKWRMIEIEYK